VGVFFLYLQQSIICNYEYRYEIMWKCWNPDPDKRPTFADLVYKIGGILNLNVVCG
jgi:hypothetical protein